MSLKHGLTILFCLILFNTHLLAFDQYETFEKDGQYGLRNTETKEVVLEARYEAVGWSDKSFSVIDNTVGVRQNEKWALASIDGNRITQHIYTVLYPFTQDLLIAGVRSQFSILDKLGVISIKGKEAISLEYDLLNPLNDKLVAGSLVDRDYLFGLLSKNGRKIITQEYKAIKSVEGSLLSVTNKEGLSAIFNTNGDQLSPFRFEDIRPHTSDYLRVTFYNHQALVDKSGKVVTPTIYKEIKLNERGKTLGLPFKKWTLFNKNQGEVSSYYFDKIIPLNSSELAIQSGNYLGVVDKEETYRTYLPDVELLGVYHGLLLVSNGQYQGVMNKSGQLILPLNYDSVDIKERMIFGQIRRRDKQDWQVYDHRGTLQNNQKYESYNQITQYITYAKRNGKSGLLDGRGKEASPFFYDAIRGLRGNKMVVAYQGSEGVINDQGNWITTPYKDALTLLDQYVLYRQGTQWGTLDFNEEVLFRSQKPLKPLIANLLTSQDEDGYQLLNYKGSFLREEHYDSIYALNAELLVLENSDRKWLFRPSDFRLSEAPENTELITRYANGLISAKIDGQWGFINELGQLRIANRYEQVEAFSEDLAAVKLIGKWGVINKEEEIIVQPSYDRMASFKAQRALVMQNNKWGLIDQTGRLILDLKYDSIQRFEKHIILTTNGKLGLADARGNIVRTPQFDKIKSIGNQLFIVSRQGKYGVISLSGQDQVPVAFDKVIPFGNDFLASESPKWEVIPKQQ